MNKILIILGFVCNILFAQHKDYSKEIRTYRKDLVQNFKNKNESPLPAKELKKFIGLPFFPVDKKYRVKAKLEFTFNTPIFYLQNTKGKSEAYQQYAIATFSINKQQLQLSIYQSITLKNKKGYENYLFIPFTDLTNGKSTYIGGRYLDTRIPEEYTGTILLDFNKAYNPYCAYNKNYICPIPPKKNHLDISILAGVKY